MEWEEKRKGKVERLKIRGWKVWGGEALIIKFKRMQDENRGMTDEERKGTENKLMRIKILKVKRYAGTTHVVWSKNPSCNINHGVETRNVVACLEAAAKRPTRVIPEILRGNKSGKGRPGRRLTRPHRVARKSVVVSGRHKCQSRNRSNATKKAAHALVGFILPKSSLVTRVPDGWEAGRAMRWDPWLPALL